MLGTICEQCGEPTNDYTTECLDCMMQDSWTP